MPPVPVLGPGEVVKAFERLGWEVTRRRGSHIILTKVGHRATLSIPNHPEIARGTLRSLIRYSGVSLEEFLNAVRR
ncbi:MAG: type II toxin-antitoxin system HicA family toxin [Actinomycetota bacterium]